MVTKLGRKAVIARGQRAVSDDLKEVRRAAILRAALSLFRKVPFDSITVAAVAAEAGIAKGTVYLYFATREALFLALLTEQFEDWFAALDVWLDEPADGPFGPVFVDWAIASLVARPLFVRLIAIMHTVLEHNIELATALPFKQLLAARAGAAGERLSARMGWPDPLTGMRLLLWLHGITIGLQHMSAPAPVVRQAMRRDAQLQIFDLDFGTELRALLTQVLTGMTLTHGDRA